MNNGRDTELTALMVDDSRAIRELLAAMLQNLGVARILQAEDGVSAFRVLEQAERPIDLLFCDLAMPGVDGVETLRGLAARQIEAGVVLLSGLDPKLMATVADMADQFGLRVLGAVSKPFREEQIAAMLDEFRRTRQPQCRRRSMLMITSEELDAALDDGRIDVYYQPKIRLGDGQLIGVEALARMHHPAYGVIEPDAFIPLAEESSQRITRLTLQVLEQAIGQAGEWQRSGLDLGMAINMSTLAIRRLDLRSILETSIDLGRRLRMAVVAEGVENWNDWQLLENLGCDTAQGYVAARPVAAAGIPLFAERWSGHLH